jgi:hypothetical protein
MSLYLIDRGSTKNLFFQDNLNTIMGWLSGKFTRTGKILHLQAHPIQVHSKFIKSNSQVSQERSRLVLLNIGRRIPSSFLIYPEIWLFLSIISSLTVKLCKDLVLMFELGSA